MKFEGIMPALITPLNEDESINQAVLKDLLEDFLQQGADGFYIAGATGEGLALRAEERMKLTETVVRVVHGQKPCIIQVASMNNAEMIALAKHAENCGAAAISATAPLFFRYDEDDVFNYYRKLAAAVHIPVMVYYSPAANFPMNAAFAARLFEIDNVTAIKWTSSDYFQMMELKNKTHGEMNIINGPDEMLLMGLSAGADGGIGSTYNYMLKWMKEIYENFHTGNIEKAPKTQRKVAAVIDVLRKYPIIPVSKLILEALGYPVGYAAFPQKRFSHMEKERIFAELKEIQKRLED